MSLAAKRVRNIFIIFACLAVQACGADAIVGCVKTAHGEAFVVRGTQTVPASAV